MILDSAENARAWTARLPDALQRAIVVPMWLVYGALMAIDLATALVARLVSEAYHMVRHEIIPDFQAWLSAGKPAFVRALTGKKARV